MVDTKKERIWVNSLMEKELVEILDRMVMENGSDRAKFIRLLVEQEANRRQQSPSPSNNPKRRKSDGRTAQAVAA